MFTKSFCMISCLFCIFIVFSLTTGALLVYFTHLKSINGTCQRTFIRTAQKPIGYESHPQHVIVDDFNADQHLDFAVANIGSDSIDMFLGHGNGTFLSKISHSFATGSQPYSMAQGDFNHDHHLDLAVANYGTNSIGIHIGHGDGRFEKPIIHSLGSSRPVSIAATNLNHDNHYDLVVANHGVANVMIFRVSLDDLSLQLSATYELGYDSRPTSMHLIDLNFDHVSDIVLVDSALNELVILISESNDQFLLHRYSTGTASYPISLTIGYFDADNTLDIAIVNGNSHNVIFFYGLNDGRFNSDFELHSLDLTSRPISIRTVDLTNDTLSDLVVLDSVNNQVFILEGLGNGSFTLLTKHSTGYESNLLFLAVGDFDEDKTVDVVISNNKRNTILLLSSFSIYLNGNQIEYFSGFRSYPVAASLVDVNGDGELDVIVGTGSYPTVGILLGRGDGTFHRVETFVVNTTSERVFALADMNNDGNLDIVIGQYDVSVILIYYGIGNGSFVYGETLDLGENTFTSDVALADFDHDGIIDILFTYSQSNYVFVIIRSNDDKSYQITSYPAGYRLRPTFLLPIDWNNDGLSDFIVAMYIGKSIFIYINDGNGTFNDPIQISLANQAPIALDVGDLNGDGRLDIVFVSSWTSMVGIILGRHDDSFSNFTLYSTGSHVFPTAVTLEYFNDDIHLDIAVANTDGDTILILLGVGDGTFGRSRLFPVGYSVGPSWVAMKDLNHDGQTDIVLTQENENIMSVFLIHREAAFLNERIHQLQSAPRPFAAIIADFDNNNRFDIAVTNSGTDDLQILLDYNNRTFSSMHMYSLPTGSHPQHIAIADFNNDHHLDLVITNTWSHNIQVLLNEGNGQFRMSSIYSTGVESAPISIGIGNFDEDQWMDIVVINGDTDSIQIFFGFNYMTFIEKKISVMNADSHLLDIAVADFDEDGTNDIAIADWDSSTVRLLFGNSDGTFKKQISLSTDVASKPRRIRAYDMNHDNHMDLIVIGNSQLPAGVFLGNGNGSFVLIKSFPEVMGNALAVGLADLNNDRSLDIIFMTMNDYTLFVYLSDQHGRFVTKVTRSMPNLLFFFDFDTNDLNNDRIIDIIIPSYHENTFLVLLGHGNGSFHDPILYTTDDFYGLSAVCSGHLNDDDFMDLVFYAWKNSTLLVLFGSANRGFSISITFFLGKGSWMDHMLIQDMNNDSISDIVYSDYASGFGELGIFYGRGNQSFAIRKKYIIQDASQPSRFTIADFNMDDKNDVVIIDNSKSILSILLQDKTEPFSTPITFSLTKGSRPTTIAIADMDHDNHLDLIIVNSAGNTIDLFHGSGDGSFSSLSTLSTELDSFASGMVIDDFNGDNYLDLALVFSEMNRLIIYLGDGHGEFTSHPDYSTGLGSQPSAIAVADLNDDKAMDLVICNAGTNDVIIFFGHGDGYFSRSNHYALGFNARPQSVSIGDVNGDKLVDIVVANYGINYVEILLQICSISD